MTQPFETTFILFADMLGFAELVEREGCEINELNPILYRRRVVFAIPSGKSAWIPLYKFPPLHQRGSRPSGRDRCWYGNSIFGLSIFPNRDAYECDSSRPHAYVRTSQ